MINNLISALKVEFLLDDKSQSKDFRLLESVTILGITVPAGFLCDGASFIDETNGARVAGVLHDFLYRTKTKYTRKEADVLFYDALVLYGTSRWKAQIAYRGVRSFGYFIYKKNQSLLVDPDTIIVGPVDEEDDE